MYLSFFGLSEKPFAITPDARYLFLSERHAEAIAHLLYGINEAGGFVQLTGEVGTGKTTVVRSLLAQTPKDAEIALILNPRITAPEFLLTICEELGIGVPDSATQSVKDLVDILNDYLLQAHARGRRVVLVVDEAQNLATDVLEQVRLLTNLETSTQKLLQIILIGQPELRELLARNELRQLAQRITGRFHLDPLSRSESTAYVRHRLRVAGSTSDIFTAAALREVYRLSGGVPRIINVICDATLVFGYAEERSVFDAAMLSEVLTELEVTGVLPAEVKDTKEAKDTKDTKDTQYTKDRPAAVSMSAISATAAAVAAAPALAAAESAARAASAAYTTAAVAAIEQRERALRQREIELAEQRRVLAEEYRLLRQQHAAQAAPAAEPVTAGSHGHVRLHVAGAGPTRFDTVRVESFWDRVKRIMLGVSAS